MQKCPVEIVEAIISRTSSKADLLNLRIVNRPFHDLVTPKVFRSVDVRNSVKSVMKLVQIRECERLVPLVEEILFDPRMPETGFEIKVQGPDFFGLYTLAYPLLNDRDHSIAFWLEQMKYMKKNRRNCCMCCHAASVACMNSVRYKLFI